MKKSLFNFVAMICMVLFSSVLFSACDFNTDYYALTYDKTTSVYEIKSSQSLASIKKGDKFTFEISPKNGYDISGINIVLQSKANSTNYTSSQYTTEYIVSTKKWSVVVNKVGEDIFLIISNIPVQDRLVNFYESESSAETLCTMNINESNNIILSNFTGDYIYDKANRKTKVATSWYYVEDGNHKTFNIDTDVVTTLNLNLYGVWETYTEIGVDITNQNGLAELTNLNDSWILRNKDGSINQYREGNIKYYTIIDLIDDQFSMYLQLKNANYGTSELAVTNMSGDTIDMADYAFADEVSTGDATIRVLSFSIEEIVDIGGIIIKI